MRQRTAFTNAPTATPIIWQTGKVEKLEKCLLLMRWHKIVRSCNYLAADVEKNETRALCATADYLAPTTGRLIKLVCDL